MFPYDEVGRSLQGPTGLHIIMPRMSLTPLIVKARAADGKGETY